MSRSVSAPSSVTKTSPCWNGFIVPGSTLRYGSSFCIVTRSPRCLSRLPNDDAVSPLPSEEATPPVTNRCLVIWFLDSAAAKVHSRRVGVRREDSPVHGLLAYPARAGSGPPTPLRAVGRSQDGGSTP